ncbi:hypothetical protein ABI59_03790 [Acidobacteria bacterium Mor1]|nr:hypothetical protein ABI59_03790 [Acidobacteria bacterium Mor1]
MADRAPGRRLPGTWPVSRGLRVVLRPEPDATDLVLVERAQNGEVRALETLIERHESRVLRVLRLMGVPHQDREDVAQEVFVRVFRHLRGFRRGRAFHSWIYKISVNAAHDYRSRSRGGAGAESLDGFDEWEPADTRLGESAEAHALRSALEGALEQLSDRERAVFVLRELEDLDTREVARALGITSITVRRHLGRARNRLQELMEQASIRGISPPEQKKVGGD